MQAPCTRHARAMHAPCTRHARAMHAPCARHARTVHMRHARAMHAPCTHVHAPCTHVHMPCVPPSPARRRRGGVARLRWWRPVGDAAAVTHRRRAPTLYILLLRLPRAGQAAPTERRWEARCESRHRAQAGPPRAAAGGLRRRRRRVFGQASAAAQPSCRPQVAAGLARRSPLYAVRLQLCRRRLLRWRRPASLGLL